MHIHIENINVYINGDDVKKEIEGPVTFDIDTTEVFPEEVAAAEEVLFEAQDEEVIPAEDYWDKAVDDAVKPTTFEPKSLVEVNAGYCYDSLAGKVGRVVKDLSDEPVLVEFDGWTKGHDGGLADYSHNRWWIRHKELSSYSLKVGDKVIHKGDGTGEEFQDDPYSGYNGQSLVGKVGTVIKDTDDHNHDLILIDWHDWLDDHNHPISPDTGSRWWTSIDNLNKVEQWNS